MVPISNGILEIGAHVWSVIVNLIFLRYLFTAKTVGDFFLFEKPVFLHTSAPFSELPSVKTTICVVEAVRSNHEILIDPFHCFLFGELEKNTGYQLITDHMVSMLDGNSEHGAHEYGGKHFHTCMYHVLINLSDNLFLKYLKISCHVSMLLFNFIPTLNI